MAAELGAGGAGGLLDLGPKTGLLPGGMGVASESADAFFDTRAYGSGLLGGLLLSLAFSMAAAFADLTLSLAITETVLLLAIGSCERHKL